MSKFIVWELPIDFQKFDKLNTVKCGSDLDITLGISEVTDPVSVQGFDRNNLVLWTVTDYITLEKTGLCKVTGNLTSEWGVPRAYERLDLFSDNLEDNKAIWTNTQGDFIFIGTPGQRFKIKVQKDWNYYWFMIPDKAIITFDDLLNDYGYTTDD
jgi:hypothetical protein